MAGRRANLPVLEGAERRKVQRMLRRGAEPEEVARYLCSRGWEAEAAGAVAAQEDARHQDGLRAASQERQNASGRRRTVKLLAAALIAAIVFVPLGFVVVPLLLSRPHLPAGLPIRVEVTLRSETYPDGPSFTVTDPEAIGAVVATIAAARGGSSHKCADIGAIRLVYQNETTGFTLLPGHADDVYDIADGDGFYHMRRGPLLEALERGGVDTSAFPSGDY